MGGDLRNKIRKGLSAYYKMRGDIAKLSYFILTSAFVVGVCEIFFCLQFNFLFKMKAIKCCIPGCTATGVTMHRFPNLKKYREQFNKWLDVIGLQFLRDMDPESVYQNKRICFAHFDPTLKSPGNPRLHRNAIPSLGLPGTAVEITGSLSLNVDEPGMAVQSLASPEVVVLPDNPVLSEIQDLPEFPQSSTDAVMNNTTDMEPISSALSPARNESPTSFREGELLRSVGVTRITHLTPKARKMYDTALMFKRRGTQNRKRCLSFKQRLSEAEEYSQSKSFQNVAKSLTPTAERFMWLQMRESSKKPKGRRFTIDEKTMALSLFKRSPKGYDLLQEMFTLPGRKTLNNFLRRLKLKPGINAKLFMILKKQVEKMPEHHRICTLLFDEMSLSSSLAYSQQNDCVDGFVDDGNCKRVAFADHALVFMARGVIKKWKQPVSFSFCEGATKSDNLRVQIKATIAALQEAGLVVVATVCDQGKPNQKAIKDLVEETRLHNVQTNGQTNDNVFEINGQIIVPLYDPPHLLKCVRNNLLKGNLHFKMNGQDMVAKWAHLEEVYRIDTEEEFSDLRELPKLTEAHINPQHREKMKVSFCSQVFSQRVAATLRSKAKQYPEKSEMTSTALLFVFMDKLFDSVNSTSLFAKNGKNLRGALKEGSDHEAFWIHALEVLQSMEYVDLHNPLKRSKPDCLKNWIFTIRGFQLIWKNLKGMGIRFVLLRNFNQDPLENFFGSIRSHGLRNINPTTQSFVGAYKTLIVNNFMAPHSVGANCEADSSLGALTTLKEIFAEQEEEQQRIPMWFGNISVIINTNETADATQKSNFCCGYVLKKLKKLINSCKECNEDLRAVKIGMQHTLISEREYTNYQALHYPSFSAVTAFVTIKKIMYYVLENHIINNNIVKNAEMLCRRKVDFTFISCEVHKEELTKNIIIETIMLILYGYMKETNRILTGKKLTSNLVGDKIKKLAKSKYEKYLKNKNCKK